MELPDIFKPADLSVLRPTRTSPENQEVAEEDEGEDGEDEIEGVREGFIALSTGHCDMSSDSEFGEEDESILSVTVSGNGRNEVTGYRLEL